MKNLAKSRATIRIMPLTGSEAVLSAAIKAQLLGNQDAGAVDNDALTALCDSIAAAVVPHLVANAVVVPTLLVAPSGGGPVTGTGVVT